MKLFNRLPALLVAALVAWAPAAAIVVAPAPAHAQASAPAQHPLEWSSRVIGRPQDWCRKGLPTGSASRVARGEALISSRLSGPTLTSVCA